jgi:hypothetical protein
MANTRNPNKRQFHAYYDEAFWKRLDILCKTYGINRTDLVYKLVMGKVTLIDQVVRAKT